MPKLNEKDVLVGEIKGVRLPESESLHVVGRDPLGRDPVIYVLIEHFFGHFLFDFCSKFGIIQTAIEMAGI